MSERLSFVESDTALPPMSVDDEMRRVDVTRSSRRTRVASREPDLENIRRPHGIFVLHLIWSSQSQIYVSRVLLEVPHRAYQMGLISSKTARLRRAIG